MQTKDSLNTYHIPSHVSHVSHTSWNYLLAVHASAGATATAANRSRSLPMTSSGSSCALNLTSSSSIEADIFGGEAEVSTGVAVDDEVASDNGGAADTSVEVLLGGPIMSRTLRRRPVLTAAVAAEVKVVDEGLVEEVEEVFFREAFNAMAVTSADSWRSPICWCLRTC